MELMELLGILQKFWRYENMGICGLFLLLFTEKIIFKL